MNGLHALRLGSLSLRWRPRAALACLVLAGVGLALAAALLGTGSLALGPAEVFASLLGQGQDPTAQRIVQRVRLPRVLTACLVGAALGMAGAIFQSISRNPLGSPDVIGFTTGAASGAIVQIILFDAGQMVLVAVGMTAIATAAAGPIAFIALAGPQLARRLTRSAGVPLLSGALMGAVLLLAADLLGQRLAYVANLPIGLMTGLLGGFYLLWLLLRSRRI
ncbi:iron chelate uptake ABC transporter family permease subunit [Pseudomonas aeruginosa]|uniref:iron chelate uptake ABC transporter family permease subunit n=1 Tax=Pseudomonas aeruginosa TaxID=287 RepID=UPI001042C2DC|nr:iron chelate uptake ABC transporter family permease subunit [Pseudomonas aeruginosa]